MDEPQYKDDDLVYVDPSARTVVGLVEWSQSGKPKSIPMKEEAGEEGEDGKRRKPRRYYPWGTYRTVKRLYKIGDWKAASESRQISLDEAIEKSLKEPFWD